MLMSLAAGCVLDTRDVDTVRVAAEAGCPATGIWVANEVGDWDDARARATRRALDDRGLVALDIELVRIVPGPFRDRWRRLVDIGAAIGARNLLVLVDDPDPASATATFAELCEHCAAAGMRACLEFMGFTAVRSLGEALAVVNGAAHPAGAVLLDNLHLARTGGTPADVAALDPALLPYAQWCDAPAGPPGDGSVDALRAEALDGRSCPGEGGLPAGAFVRALPPETPLALEVRSAAYVARHPDPVDRARAILERTRAAVDTLAAAP
jgi:sugar phosphate isomerase/epimerase